MPSKLKLIEKFSGPNASVYSVLVKTAADTPPELLVDRFIQRNVSYYEPELMDIARRLRSLGNITGCTENFFKLDEGLEAHDMVCALYDEPDREMRLYCIRLSTQILIIGDGGPKRTRTWQEDGQLKSAVHEMMHVSKIVRTKLNDGSLRISSSGLMFEGDLFISRT